MEDIEQMIVRCDRFPLVRNAGFGRTDKVWTHPARCLDFHVFLFINSGQFQVIEEGVEYVLQAGETAFLTQGRHHWGLPKTPPGSSWFWIHYHDPSNNEFDSSALEPDHHLRSFFRPEDYQTHITIPKRQTLVSPDTIRLRMKRLVDIFKSDHPTRAMRLGLQTAELWLELHQQSQSHRKKSKSDILVGRVIRFLEQADLSKKFSAAVLAEHLKMNYNYISSTFTEKTGISINEYFIRLRINKSMELLKNPAYNISEISQLIGFYSPYHFSRVFKKINGVSPSDYLKQIYRGSDV